MTLAQERELLLGMKSDKKLFGVLYDNYFNSIFGYLYQRTGNYSLGQDMAAETFLKAYFKIDDFVWREISVSSWLYRIATNEANQFFRKRKYQPGILEKILDIELLQLTTSEEDRLLLEAEMKAHDDFVLVQEKLKELPLHYQEVIALRYFENKDNVEIGRILEKPEGTIKSLLSRGLEKLRALVLK